MRDNFLPEGDAPTMTPLYRVSTATRLRVSMPVRVRVDTFPGIDLHACADSLAPASGLEFSLLPPDNATGNFTKIVQRIPVKIRFRGGVAQDLGAVRNAFGQVAAALQALDNDAESLSAQQRALDSAVESLTLTRQAYAAGNAGYLQVLDAERLHQQAELGRVQSYGQRYVDVVKLLLAAGGRTDVEVRPDFRFQRKRNAVA